MHLAVFLPCISILKWHYKLFQEAKTHKEKRKGKIDNNKFGSGQEDGKRLTKQKEKLTMNLVCVLNSPQA